MKKLLLSLIALTSINVFAASDTEVNVIDQLYSNMRSRGMGGAITASADDYAAIFFNPAMLTQYKDDDHRTNMAIGMAYSPDVMTFLDDLGTATGKEPDAVRLQAIADLLQEYDGQVFYANPFLHGIWAKQNHSFAFLPLNVQFDMSPYYDSGDPLNGSGLRMNGRVDMVLAYGYAKQIKKNFSVGLTTKLVNRLQLNLNMTPNDLTDTDFADNQNAGEGATIDFDLGMYYKPENPWGKIDPAFSFVVRNLIDSGFTMQFGLLGDQNSKPDKLQRRFDIGSEFKIPKFWVFQPRVTFDIRDIGHTEWTAKKGSHLGFELDWSYSSLLDGAYRIGLNQGFFSAGIQLQFTWFRLDIATWGESSGTGDNEVESRSTAFTMSLDF